jgi:pimeloyl-ACP methyl ester carboxylesterase
MSRLLRRVAHYRSIERVVPLVASVAWLITSATSLPAQENAVVWEPFTVRGYDGRTHDVEIGRLSVPESRTRSGAVTVIGFYRLRSSNPAPASPIVFLMGGPGIAASFMAPIPPYWDLFDTLRATADVILLDQRGLELSTPHVDCPPVSEGPDAGFLSSREAFVRAYGKVVAACAAHYRARGVDPAAFTDAAIADDVDDIRLALHAQRVSLLGFSYGTRLAMTYARRHPDHVDRMVLQGPTDEQLMYRSSLGHDSLFVRLAAAAAADTVSAGFSANLVGRTRALLAKAERTAIRVKIASVRGESLTVAVGREGLQGVIAGRIADPRIPALIQTLEHDDVAILARWIESMYNDFANGAGSLMARGTVCSQRPTTSRIQTINRDASQSMFGPAFDNFALGETFCRSLGTPPPAPTPHLAARLDRPVLIVVGTLDDRTFPSNAAALARELEKPTTLLVENGGHELLPVRAVALAVSDFFAGRDVQGRVLRVDVPRFLSIENAKQPPRRPGG